MHLDTQAGIHQQEAGFDLHIVKPVDPETLSRLIEEQQIKELPLVGRLQALDHLAFGIARRRARAQIHVRDVPLVQSDEA